VTAGAVWQHKASFTGGGVRRVSE